MSDARLIRRMALKGILMHEKCRNNLVVFKKTPEPEILIEDLEIHTTSFY